MLFDAILGKIENFVSVHFCFFCNICMLDFFNELSECWRARRVACAGDRREKIGARARGSLLKLTLHGVISDTLRK
jgi:hypothetical protein